jgi:hypothetical protein
MVILEREGRYRPDLTQVATISRQRMPWVERCPTSPLLMST